MSLRRRELLHLFGASWALAGCRDASPAPCIVTTGSPSASYCLVAGEVLRVPNVRALAIGQAILLNVDDNTAVIVARDVDGFYALSAICTHQCCLGALCTDAACVQLGTNPGECAETAVTMPSPTAAAIVCPCHGSTFALDGAVLTGPAVRPLPHYDLAFERDDALVDTNQTVVSTSRTAA